MEQHEQRETRSFLAHNMALTPRHLGQVADVIRDCYGMGFGMFSFQPAAYVGDDRRWHEPYREIDPDAVWAQIEQGAGARLDYRSSGAVLAQAWEEQEVG